MKIYNNRLFERKYRFLCTLYANNNVFIASLNFVTEWHYYMVRISTKGLNWYIDLPIVMQWHFFFAFYGRPNWIPSIFSICILANKKTKFYSKSNLKHALHTTVESSFSIILTLQLIRYITFSVCCFFFVLFSYKHLISTCSPVIYCKSV